MSVVTLTTLDSDRLTEYLLDCNSIRNLSSRDRIVRDLRIDIRNRIESSGIDKTHVKNILEACADFENGLEEFIERVKYHEGDSIPMSRVLIVWNGICDLFNKNIIVLQQALELAAIAESNTEKFYIASLAGLPPIQKPYSIQLILQHLNEILIQSRSKTYPLLDFALYFVQTTINEDAKKQIISWLQIYIPKKYPEFNVVRIQDRLTQISKNVIQRPQANPVLLVVLQKVMKSGEQWKFSLEYFLWEDEQKISRITDALDLCVMDEIQKNIFWVLEKIGEELGVNCAKLSIEFFLKSEEMDFDVTTLLYKAPKFPRPLGYNFPVVLRSLDRIKAGLPRSKLEFRWSNFQNIDNLTDFSRMCKSNDSPDTIYDELMRDESIVCLYIPFAPAISNGEMNVIDSAIQSGIPLVLWFRKLDNDPVIEQNIKGLLSSCDKQDLPKYIQQRRLQLNQNLDDWIHHLVVLFDNPTRIPPDTHAPRLSMPKQ